MREMRKPLTNPTRQKATATQTTRQHHRTTTRRTNRIKQDLYTNQGHYDENSHSPLQHSTSTNKNWGIATYGNIKRNANISTQDEMMRLSFFQIQVKIQKPASHVHMGGIFGIGFAPHTHVGSQNYAQIPATSGNST